jgi:hypothetical protein
MRHGLSMSRGGAGVQSGRWNEAFQTISRGVACPVKLPAAGPRPGEAKKKPGNLEGMS